MQVQKVFSRFILSICLWSNTIWAGVGSMEMDATSVAVKAGAGAMVQYVPKDINPHEPINSTLLTYGQIGERFAVEPSLHGHEIIGIDGLFAALRDSGVETSISLKGLKPYMPFTKWAIVTEENKGFFSNRKLFPFMPEAVMAGRDLFQLAYYFPSAFGIEKGPIYLLIHHNSKLGMVPKELMEEFKPYGEESKTLSKEGEKYQSNLAAINVKFKEMESTLSNEDASKEQVKYYADYGVLEAILLYADSCVKSDAEEDLKEAIKYYKLAAEGGDTATQIRLGLRYANGDGVEKDEKEAVRLYRLAYEQGNIWGQNNLGWMYENGWGIEQNYEEAFRLYKLSAEGGCVLAQDNLARMYKNGKGVLKDESEAFKWYKLAADQGDASAQNNLGIMYENGEGIEKDKTEAVKWYRKAADQGYASAQYNLAVMYDYGRGVAKDEAEAVKWYKLAADQGDASAQNNLGYMYKLGSGVAVDMNEALRYFRMAIDNGNISALDSLGEMYRDGCGVERDETEAVIWFRKAAEAGDDAGQYNLGTMYQNGRGVVKDDAEAVKWYRLAAAQGNASAQIALERLSV